MNVVQVHNSYRYLGGEDTVVAAEAAALEQAGHRVHSFRAENQELRGLALLGVAWRAPHDPAVRARLRAFLLARRADVMHVHNWFPRLSPAVYFAARDVDVPVVQTLHNYRLGCASGTFRRAGAACRACPDGGISQALRHRCYRGSLSQTAVWAATVSRLRRSGALEIPSAYVAPSQTVAKGHRGLVPSDRLIVLPHGCRDPYPTGPRPLPTTGPALFVGRLVREKGVDVLLDAWRGIDHPLWIVGEGPARAELEARAGDLPQVHFLGKVAPVDVSRLYEAASLVVAPHRWEEPFGMVVIEAFAAARPIVASRLGGPAELIDEERTGQLVAPEDPHALRVAVQRLLAQPQRLVEQGAASRAAYCERFTTRAQAARLGALYSRLVEARRAAA